MGCHCLLRTGLWKQSIADYIYRCDNRAGKATCPGSHSQWWQPEFNPIQSLTSRSLFSRHLRLWQTNPGLRILVPVPLSPSSQRPPLLAHLGSAPVTSASPRPSTELDAEELQHSLTDQAGIAGPDGTQAAASCTRHGTLPRTQVDGAGRQHTGLFKSTVSWSPSGGERNALLFVACRHDLTKPRDGQTIKRN